MILLIQGLWTCDCVLTCTEGRSLLTTGMCLIYGLFPHQIYCICISFPFCCQNTVWMGVLLSSPSFETHMLKIHYCSIQVVFFPCFLVECGWTFVSIFVAVWFKNSLDSSRNEHKVLHFQDFWFHPTCLITCNKWSNWKTVCSFST